MNEFSPFIQFSLPTYSSLMRWKKSDLVRHALLYSQFTRFFAESQTKSYLANFIISQFYTV